MSSEPQLGDRCTVQSNVLLGEQTEGTPPIVGNDATIRAGTIIYPDVAVGDRFTTGHNALVRERTIIGDDVVVGTGTIIDGQTTIGDAVSIQTGVYVPTNTTIGDRVFLGPRAVLTNDPHPVRFESDLDGPTIEDDATIGANATLLPGVTIGEGAFVAAGAIVTDDVPPETLAVGVPARHVSLPEYLLGPNNLP
ncbi:DapH/DapD/GlmU-related protein (plasmid) [Haloferacaceae archaeon DSL9]